MNRFITHLLAVALGFGVGFFIFVEPNGDSLVLTLGEVGQMSAEELHEFLITNEDCAQLSDHTIDCEF